MKAPIPRKLTETAQERQRRREMSIELLRLRGDNRPIDPPRGVIPQSGSRKAVVSWDAPMRRERITGFCVYKDSALYETIRDPRSRQCEVSITAGTSANISVSSLGDGYTESARVTVIGSATTEAGAPSDPATPPSVAESADTASPTRTTRKFRDGVVLQD